MEMKSLSEKAVTVLDENYDWAKKFALAGKRDVAMSLYHGCAYNLEFMRCLELISFKEYRKLMDKHHGLFDSIFGA